MIQLSFYPDFYKLYLMSYISCLISRISYLVSRVICY